MTEASVDTQVISNLVVRNRDGAVLFVRYAPENEKWWLPGGDVEPFTHPDDTATRVLEDIGGIEAADCRLSYVESFRGRRGWHLVFNYDVHVAGEPTGPHQAQWFQTDRMPRTVHGNWEKGVVAQVCGLTET